MTDAIILTFGMSLFITYLVFLLVRFIGHREESSESESNFININS